MTKVLFDARTRAAARCSGPRSGGVDAVIAGRRTYDDSVRWWGPDGPSGAANRVPVFVVTGRQYIAAGLVDEVRIHLVPVLLGGGLRMFEDLRAGLEQLEVFQSSTATHFRCGVSR